MDKKKELLYKSNIHCANDYIASNEDIIVTGPSTNNIDNIRLAPWRWRCTSDGIKQAWKSKACEMNELQILGIFTLKPSVITKNAVLNMLTQEHYRFRSSINNILKLNQSVTDSVQKKILVKR